MGWADCGTDSKGRPIGYAFEAKCDHPGCNEEIDRGLSYACGDMHGQTEVGCEGYFCEKHRATWVLVGREDHSVCDTCAERMVKNENWKFDDEECALVHSDE